MRRSVEGKGGFVSISIGSKDTDEGNECFITLHANGLLSTSNICVPCQKCKYPWGTKEVTIPLEHVDDIVGLINRYQLMGFDEGIFNQIENTIRFIKIETSQGVFEPNIDPALESVLTEKMHELYKKYAV